MACAQTWPRGVIFSVLSVLPGPAALESIFPLLPLGQAQGSYTAEVEPHGSRFSASRQWGGGEGDGSDWRPSPPAAALQWAEEEAGAVSPANKVCILCFKKTLPPKNLASAHLGA